MKTYEKIETIFNREIDGSKKLIWESYRNKTVEYLKNATWEFTEKVDGTNIRVCWDGYKVSFAGRTDKAQIPEPLMKHLESVFCTNEAHELFEQTFGGKEVILFGEGYGGKIQNGKGYRNDESFLLFDVCIGSNYQEKEWVEKTAKMFGIDTVPSVFKGTLGQGIAFVMTHPKSLLADTYMEGIVAKPIVELKDRTGERIIVKIKWADFKCFVGSEENGI